MTSKAKSSDAATQAPGRSPAGAGPVAESFSFWPKSWKLVIARFMIFESGVLFGYWMFGPRTPPPTIQGVVLLLASLVAFIVGWALSESGDFGQKLEGEA